MLLAHGFGGSKQSVRQEAVRLAEAGYAVLTWSARGFGRSTGEIALNSPDYEVKDVQQLIDWLAKRPEVRLDAAGDPRVGIAGGSYGGAIALMAAAHDARVDAIVPQITWSDLADALFPDVTGKGPENGVFKRMWAGIFFGRGGAGAGGRGRAGPGRRSTGSPRPLTAEQARCGRFLPAICEVYQEVAETGRATPEALALLAQVQLRGGGRADQGADAAHPGPARLAVPAGARPTPTPGRSPPPAPRSSLAWFDGGHDGGNGEADWLHEQTTAWFARYLKGDGPPAGSAFTVTRDGGRDPGTRQRDPPAPRGRRLPRPERHRRHHRPAHRPRAEHRQPARRLPRLDLHGARRRRPAGRPGHRERLARHARPERRLRLRAADRPAPAHRQPHHQDQGVRQRRGDAVRQALRRLRRRPAAGPARRLVAPLRVTVPEGAELVEVDGHAARRRLPLRRGHRLRLVLATTDLGYATPAEPATYRIGLASPALSVPTVRHAGRAGDRGRVVGLGDAARLVVLAGVLLVTRRRRAAAPASAAAPDGPVPRWRSAG